MPKIVKKAIVRKATSTTSAVKTKKTPAKKYSRFRPLILSRHPSHNILRARNKMLPLFSFPSVIRFGSSTEVEDTVAKGGRRVEINTVASIKISANKSLMKDKFVEAGVKTAPFFKVNSNNVEEFINQAKELTDDFKSKLVCKAHHGSKGQGNTLVSNEEELRNWAEDKRLASFIYEKFINYALEFRLHITEEGYFYTCRKALRKDCPEDQKWRHHDDTCVWLLETNEDFKKPNSFDDIVSDCVKALKAIGADILSFDVKVQGPIDGKGRPREYQDYILLESNSASSMGDYIEGQPSICAQKYIEILPQVINNKYFKNAR